LLQRLLGRYKKITLKELYVDI